MPCKVIDLKEQNFPAQKTSILPAMADYPIIHMVFRKVLAPKVAAPAVLHIKCG